MASISPAMISRTVHGRQPPPSWKSGEWRKSLGHGGTNSSLHKEGAACQLFLVRCSSDSRIPSKDFEFKVSPNRVPAFLPWCEEDARRALNPRASRGFKTELVVEQPAEASDWGWVEDSSMDLGVLEKELRRLGLPPQKLSLSLVSEGERGLVAKENISRGESLLSIPLSLLITKETAYNCPRVGTYLERLNVPDWPALATFLLSEVVQGSNSKFYSYISTLPKVPGCILQWSEGEINTLLDGSLKEKALECIKDVEETYSDLDAQIFSNDKDLFPDNVFNLQGFKWAFAILFSRLVKIPSLDGKLALIPWADMLNHSVEVNSYLDFDKGKNAIVFKPDRNYKSSQQVFASYGPRSNSELLLAYGILPRGKNPHNSADIILGLNSQDPLFSTKREILEKYKLSSPKVFPLRTERVPFQLMSFALLLSANETTPLEKIDFWAELASSADINLQQKNTSRGSLEEETFAREIIIAAIQIALKKYKSTLQEDESLVEKLSESLESLTLQDEKLLAATELRIIERKILFRNDFVLRSELRELKSEELKKYGERTVLADKGNNLPQSKRGFLDALIEKIVRP